MNLTTIEQIAQIVAQTFSVSADSIRAETTAHDVAGWDSVTHVHLLLALEDHFHVELPAENVLKCRTIGALEEVVSRCLEPRPRVATVILFGNCQTDAMAGHLNYMASTCARARFHHVLSWEPHLADDVLANADFLWEQYAEWQEFPYSDRLPPACRKITFPSLDFTLPWPFAGTDPRNVPEPPDYPFGRCAYGDVIALQVSRDGLKGDEALRSYTERTRSRLARMSLVRLEEIEFTRWTQREAHCDVKIADYIRTNYQKVQAFYTWNHPSGWLLSEMMKRLLIASDLWDPDPDSAIARDLAYCADHWEPLSHFELPIHPIVSEILRLEWHAPDRAYRTPWELLGHDEYIRRYIEGFPG